MQGQRKRVPDLCSSTTVVADGANLYAVRYMNGNCAHG